MKSVSATDFYNFEKCKFRPYLDFNGDPSKRREVDGLIQLLWEGGVQHEANIIQQMQSSLQFNIESIDPTGHASSELFHKTLAAMTRGTDVIYQGVLMANEEVGRPDLLVKTEGSSRFGSYYYYPMDIKAVFKDEEISSEPEKPKLAYHWQLNFYAELLEKIQDFRPPFAKIFKTKDRISNYRVDSAPRGFEEAREAIRSFSKGLTAGYEPEVGGKCGQCPWSRECEEWAVRKQDLTLLFWVGGKFKYGLHEMGIQTIDQLAKADPTTLKNLLPEMKRRGFFWKTFSPTKLDDAIRRAKVMIAKKPQFYLMPKFPERNIELHYDVEDDPTQDFVYLHGFWIVERGKDPYYKAFFADSISEEGAITKELFEFLNTNHDASLFHYSSHEISILKHLARRYPEVDSSIIEHHFGEDGSAIDLYHWVEGNSDWPLTSYGLKAICKYLGFKWSADDAGGANSIVWMNAFLRGDATQKQKILKYNEDDCRATHFLKNRLIEMYQTHHHIDGES